MLFLGWLLASFLVVGAINLYLRRFGYPRSRTSKQNGGSCYATGSSGLSFGSAGRGTGSPSLAFSGSAGGGGVGGGDATNWINATIAWIYQRCHQTPDFVDTWLKSLTTEAEKQSKDIQFRFDGIHGSPPEISNIRVDDSHPDSFTIFATLSLRDVTLRLCGASGTSRNAVNCDIYLYNLKGQMKIVTKCAANNEISQQASFISPPEIRLQIRPTRTDTSLDVATIERVARAAIAGASTNLTWMSRTVKPVAMEPSIQIRNVPVHEPETVQRQTSLSSVPFRDQHMTSSPNQPFRDQQMMSSVQQPFRDQQMTSSINQPLQGVGQHHDFITPSNENNVRDVITNRQDVVMAKNDVMTPSLDLLRGTQTGFNNATATATSASGSTTRLMVKVIKANGLVDSDFGSCSAYCVTRVDNPPQNFSTNSVKNTVNPYWDEQFVFDTNSTTKQIQMEVMDREREPGNELLGKAVVLLDEIRRMPSSRQIIPLTGKPRSRTSTSGSVTVEFVFMDPQQPSTSPTQDQQRLSGPYMNEPQSRYQEKGEMQGVMRVNESPTVVVTAAETQKHKSLMPSYLNYPADSQAAQAASPKKKESFATTLKNKFSKLKKPRSQSADRAAVGHQSLREGNLLAPPSNRSATLQASDVKQGGSPLSPAVAGGSQTLETDGVRKTRSNSFSSSLRRIFKRDKKDVSRENSLSRPTSDPYNKDSSVSQQEAMNRSARQSTPVPSDVLVYTYSVSVPLAPSPLQGR